MPYAYNELRGQVLSPLGQVVEYGGLSNRVLFASFPTEGVKYRVGAYQIKPFGLGSTSLDIKFFFRNIWV